MIWQDIALFIFSLTFIVTLLDTLRKGTRLPKRISIPTGLALLGIGVTQATLGLYMAASLTFLTGILWLFVRGA
jgi:hypothetical protein